MKRKTGCVCGFVLYSLVVCWMLSVKIQEEMTTQLFIRPITLNEKSNGYFTLSLDCIFQQGDQAMFLELKEGSGWTPGARITAVEPEAYNIDLTGGYVSLIPVHDRQIIRHASRFPVVGERGTAVQQELISDEYLMLYPGVKSQNECNLTGAALVAESEQARLLSLAEAESPFLKDQAGEKLYQIGGERCQIFSLHETALFFQNLPCLALLAVVLWSMLVNWLSLIFFSSSSSRKRLVCRAVFLSLLPVLLIIVLQKIDLPASLLPPQQITDWEYYIEEFQKIFATLTELGMENQSLFPLRQSMEKTAGCILAAGCVFPLLPGKL